MAYFATPARGWEFALGGLAAVALRRPPQGRSWLRWGLGWAGLAILLGTGLVLQVSTVFPGYAALLPTGAALLILLSARNGIAGGADSLLSTRWLVYLGGISYGIYLWHYPLLKFYRSERDTETNSIVERSRDHPRRRPAGLPDPAVRRAADPCAAAAVRGMPGGPSWSACWASPPRSSSAPARSHLTACPVPRASGTTRR